MILARSCDSSRMMFDGLMSRCTRPAACAAARPSATWQATLRGGFGFESLVRFDPLAERRAGDILHHQPDRPIRRIGHRIHGHDVVVLDAGGRARLADKRSREAWSARSGRSTLSATSAIELRIEGLEDNPHSAAAQLAQNAIRPELLGGGKRQAAGGPRFASIVDPTSSARRASRASGRRQPLQQPADFPAAIARSGSSRPAAAHRRRAG